MNVAEKEQRNADWRTNNLSKNCGYTFLPAVYGSIKEAVNDLKLDKRVKWKVWDNELCRYTKKSICPEYVVKNGMPVQIILPTPT